MHRFISSAVLACTLAVTGALAHADIISLDQYNHTGPFWNQDDYVYHGLSFSVYNVGTGYVGADWYSGYSIRINSLRGLFELNAVTLATFQNLETDPGGPYAVRDITVYGYSNGVQVGATAFHLDQTDGVYRWFNTDFSTPVDSIILRGDGLGHVQWYGMNALDVTPVPEPETWALLGIGAVALAARRRRRAGRALPA